VRDYDSRAHRERNPSVGPLQVVEMPTYTRKEGDMVVTYSESEYKAIKEKEDEMPNWQIILLILVTFPISVPLIVAALILVLIIDLFWKIVGLFKD
jgi:hypothetical protein